MKGPVTPEIRRLISVPPRPSKFFAALAQADEKIADDVDVRCTFTRAVGVYTCSCGESFEFTADGGIDDFAALNRWLGRHESCEAPTGTQAPYAAAMAIVNGLRP